MNIDSANGRNLQINHQNQTLTNQSDETSQVAKPSLLHEISGNSNSNEKTIQKMGQHLKRPAENTLSASKAHQINDLHAVNFLIENEKQSQESNHDSKIHRPILQKAHQLVADQNQNLLTVCRVDAEANQQSIARIQNSQASNQNQVKVIEQDKLSQIKSTIQTDSIKPILSSDHKQLTFSQIPTIAGNNSTFISKPIIFNPSMQIPNPKSTQSPNKSLPQNNPLINQSHNLAALIQDKNSIQQFDQNHSLDSLGALQQMLPQQKYQCLEMLQNKQTSIQKPKWQRKNTTLWDKTMKYFQEIKSCPLIFIKDGTIVKPDGEKQQMPQSIKIDIKPLIIQNTIQAPNLRTIQSVQEHEKIQSQFFMKAYNDILEVCNSNLLEYNLDKQRESELIDQIKKGSIQHAHVSKDFSFKQSDLKNYLQQTKKREMDCFRMMWSVKGQPLYTLEDLMKYVYHQQTKPTSSINQSQLQSSFTTPVKNGSIDLSGDESPANNFDTNNLQPTDQQRSLLIIVSFSRPLPLKQIQLEKSKSLDNLHELTSSQFLSETAANQNQMNINTIQYDNNNQGQMQNNDNLNQNCEQLFKGVQTHMDTLTNIQKRVYNYHLVKNTIKGTQSKWSAKKEQHNPSIVQKSNSNQQFQNLKFELTVNMNNKQSQHANQISNKQSIDRLNSSKLHQANQNQQFLTSNAFMRKIINQKIIRHVQQSNSPTLRDKKSFMHKNSARQSNKSSTNLGGASTERPIQNTIQGSASNPSSVQDSYLKRKDNYSKPTFYGGIYDPKTNDTAFLLPYIQDPEKKQKLEQLEQRIREQQVRSKSKQENNKSGGLNIDSFNSTIVSKDQIPVKFQNLRIVSQQSAEQHKLNQDSQLTQSQIKQPYRDTNTQKLEKPKQFSSHFGTGTFRNDLYKKQTTLNAIPQKLKSNQRTLNIDQNELKQQHIQKYIQKQSLGELLHPFSQRVSRGSSQIILNQMHNTPSEIEQKKWAPEQLYVENSIKNYSTSANPNFETGLFKTKVSKPQNSPFVNSGYDGSNGNGLANKYLPKKQSKKTLKNRHKFFKERDPDDKNSSNGSLSYEQVKVLSLEYRLPSKIIYQLNSEFSILVNVVKKKQQNSPIDYEIPLKHGIPAYEAFDLIAELKTKNLESAKRILEAMGIRHQNKQTVIGWTDYLKLMTVIKYFTAPKSLFLDFWMSFFNPEGLPQLQIKDIYYPLELLVRGKFTDESTLISERFATGFCRILYEKKCLREVKDYHKKITLTKKKTYSDLNTLTDNQDKIDGEQAVNENKNNKIDQQVQIKSKALQQFDAEMEKLTDKNFIVDMKLLRKSFLDNKIDMEYLNQIFRTNTNNFNDQDIVIVSDDEDIDQELLNRQLFGDIL